MRKLICLVAVATLVLTSCVQNGYRITGTMENAVDGDTVYLSNLVGRKLIPMDTAIVKNGQFIFTGVQDSAANRSISYRAEGNDPLSADFFLENGNIHIEMKRAQNDYSVGGTPTNDAFEKYRVRLIEIKKERESRYGSFENATIEQLAAMYEAREDDQKDFVSHIRTTIEQNITNALGAYLINMYYYHFKFEELGEFFDKLPAQYQSNEETVRLKEKVEHAKATAVGQKFIDFEMKDTEGNPVKLSDYAGKGKLVLVDFWASWCGPCCFGMPKLVEAYAKYKDKNFEIVGVSLDSETDEWKTGIEELGITWPQMSDLKKRKSICVEKYAMWGIPHLILIDGEGVIIARDLSGKQLHEKLAELLD